MTRCAKTRLLTALLLLKPDSFGLEFWIWELGTEARTEEQAKTHSVPT